MHNDYIPNPNLNLGGPIGSPDTDLNWIPNTEIYYLRTKRKVQHPDYLRYIDEHMKLVERDEAASCSCAESGPPTDYEPQYMCCISNFDKRHVCVPNLADKGQISDKPLISHRSAIFQHISRNLFRFHCKKCLRVFKNPVHMCL